MIRSIGFRIASTALLLLSGFDLIAQDCNQFREGKFTYKEVQNTYTVRKRDKQFSYYPDGTVNEFKVEWQDSCSFTMIFEKTSNPQMKTFKDGDVIYVKITEVIGRCYKFHATFNGEDFSPTVMCKDEED